MAKKEINIILGERIRELRKQKKLTREQLAEKINVSVRFLADVESGVTGVSLTTLKELSLCLDVCCDYLLGINDKESYNKYEALEKKIKKIPPEHIENIETIIDELIKLSNK